MTRDGRQYRTKSSICRSRLFPAVMLAALWLLPVRGAHAHPGAGIVVDRGGRVFFVILGRNDIMVRDVDGRVRVFVSDARLRLPHHLVLARDGSLYTASDHDGRVWRVSPNGALTDHFDSNRLWNEQRIQVGRGGDPFTVDSAGNIYATTGLASAIVHITPDSRATPIAARTRFGQLHFRAMTWGPDGALYLTGESRVWRIVGDSASAIMPRGAVLAEAVGIVLDNAGNIYVADYSTGRVVRLARDGAVNTPKAVERLALRGPTGVALGPNGELYVLDNIGRGVAIWRVQGDTIERLYGRSEWPRYAVGGLMALLPLLLALQTWVRRPKGRLDWFTWTAVAGVAILGLYWFGRAIPVFSWLRHAILALYVLGAWRSFGRTALPRNERTAEV